MGLSGLRGSKSSDVERVARGEVAPGFLAPVPSCEKFEKFFMRSFKLALCFNSAV